MERGGEFLAVVDQLAEEAEETAGAGGLVRFGRGGAGWVGVEEVGADMNTKWCMVSRKIYLGVANGVRWKDRERSLDRKVIQNSTDYTD